MANIIEQTGKRADIANPNPRLKNLNPHLLRHSIARFLKNKGFSAEWVQNFLGHESYKTTKILRKMLFKILFGNEKDFGLVLENLAFRQQLATMKRAVKQPRLRTRDRLFWPPVLLSRFWTN
jgi:hypothetical protein